MTICRYFIRGNCKKGDKCDMIHDTTICRDFHLNRRCRRGARCRFRHLSLEGKELIKGKNTESFQPSYRLPNMTVQLSLDVDNCSVPHQPDNVILVPNLFDSKRDYFTSLIQEIENAGVDNDQLWKMWHGDTHLIADDKLKWKESCPTFQEVIEKLRSYFQVDVQATRFNLYRKGEWKPYHHDAAAVDADKADRQNITIAVSFGATREIAFQYAKTPQAVEERATVSFPLPNGSVYTFSEQVNVDWRHGVLPLRVANNDGDGMGWTKEESQPDRISIIVWGWIGE